jgi:hypothetical protein
MDACNTYWLNKDLTSMYNKETLTSDTGGFDISNSHPLYQSATTDTALEQ